jgi:hypothetical protein
MMTQKPIRIAGASGFWGDAARATPQLLAGGKVDFIVYDYLAEITMSIMARARGKNPEVGYAVDFVSAAMKPNLVEIARQGVRVVSNAGGVNPQACAIALRAVITDLGLDLKVACILGDDLFDRRREFSGGEIVEMFSRADYPAVEKIASINAYLGAFPIASALDAGADIVVTGRCVDSAVTLGACIHSFGWGRQDFDQLAMGSLAGHILECGPQATGGNFTDWQEVENLDCIGYPIADISDQGSFVCCKPEGSGGLVSVGTVAEQMVYEIGDPQAYILPDVVCDFSAVELRQVGRDRVAVSGAIGRPAPDSYKICATYADEYRGGTQLTFYGIEADKKAEKLAEAVFNAARRTCQSLGLPDYSDTSVELIGAESQYGSNAALTEVREVSMKIAAKHAHSAGISILLKETVGLGLATPPGLSGFQGGRPKPSPVVRLFSFLLPKHCVTATLEIDGHRINCPDSEGIVFDRDNIDRPVPPAVPSDGDLIAVPLIALAWGRSGDKGDIANVGIIARQPEYLPYIYAALSESVVSERFAHFLPPQAHSGVYVERYLMPGTHAINFLLHQVLGGGGMASIRNDAQGKGYGQLLLDAKIPISRDLAASLSG